MVLSVMLLSVMLVSVNIATWGLQHAELDNNDHQIFKDGHLLHELAYVLAGGLLLLEVLLLVLGLLGIEAARPSLVMALSFLQ